MNNKTNSPKDRFSNRQKHSPLKESAKTSWQSSSEWYNSSVGEKGHHYHQTVILPNILKLLCLTADSKILDIACGQGILSRSIPKVACYTGIDASSTLVAEAKRMTNQSKAAKVDFIQSDVVKELPLKANDYTHAAIILALQNIENPQLALKNTSKHLIKGAKLVIVLNHPCFRIPRQSSWQVDEQNKVKFRRIDRYLSSLKIPIQTHPSKGKVSAETWSFHHSISDYSKWLKEAGFAIDLIEEWCSDKVSVGKVAKMENRSREEFPLFMTLSCVKL